MNLKHQTSQIEDEVNRIPIFDTHEHLMYEYERRQQHIDFFHLFKHYASTDLISSGMSPKDFTILQNPDIDLEKKWKLFEPHWKNIENTTYSRTIAAALTDLYGIGEINFDSAKKVTEAMKENQGTDFYSKVISGKANIEYMLNDLDALEQHDITKTEPDAPYFLPVFRPDLLFDISSVEKLEKLEQKYDHSIYSMADFINLVESIFEQRRGKLFGLKIGTAYFRNIDFEDTTFYEAEKSLLKALNLNNYDGFAQGLNASEIKPFQDYMFHYCIRKAIDLNIPIQIHTGLLESNLNDIRNSDPVYLSPVISKYGRARFDIFHAGYPYTDKLIAMVKMYRNCYFNLCWMAEVSVKLYMDILDRIIEILPSNKIFGFGGDYMFLEGCYGAQKNARKAVSEILAKRVDEGYFTPKQAIGFATKILNTNPREIYLSH